MLPTVFLSLSGKDREFVEQVLEHLPDGLAYFYPRSFENGEQLLSAMESRIGDAAIFVLFASKTSLSSVWVNFEIDRARIAKIKTPKMRVLVFMLDSDLSQNALPDWMREYWVPRSGLTPRDIARYVRGVLTGPEFSTSAQVYGRGGFLDGCMSVFQSAYLQTKDTPNIFHICWKHRYRSPHRPTFISEASIF